MLVCDPSWTTYPLAAAGPLCLRSKNSPIRLLEKLKRDYLCRTFFTASGRLYIINKDLLLLSFSISVATLT